MLRRLFPLLFTLTLALLATGTHAVADEDAPSHAAYIKGPINSGPEATKQCLKCHKKEAEHLMKTPHWTWQREQVVNGKKVKLGKINAINNFCTSTPTNRVHCSECHIGYGWRDENFDFSDQSRIDCLVCHDTTGRYHKDGDNAGEVRKGVDILEIARNVGKPSRYNCGACHFFGGGGDAVKHGDLDSSMEFPDRELDVHMSPDGLDFACQTCHVTENHQIPGANMATSPDGKNGFECTSCHDSAPHEESRLNRHTASVACQTCHIPAFAREMPTQMDWDWSTAGRDTVSAEAGIKYRKTMGTLTYKKNVIPTYAWFNGKSGVYLRGSKIDPDKPTRLTWPLGDINDKNAKIYPFKVHTGKQIYDTENKIFITAHVYGEDGFWSTFDWDKAARIGMESTGLPYSGKYGFAPTEMYWRIDHQVAPKEEALQCLDCHGDNGRLPWKELGYKGDPMDNPDYARNH
ncbi:octaheme c-type cytochrome (tetrathionate reductase family) [Geothermobacter ehrlichii]|uniref:Octaheme c-type cytochrome (Tetrathionate reductase family) n=1 Tax=Geothermobacter ehrlichii TaxID=213224 RepID=A0A5D3WM21_9BACT|nr:tetrathionate reductase family octaheme c-type cytochrome [Geothermobacter ehrlichii]TYO99077.1 octaheme c-type cytochrome (tetrathionate reductase family) [Geothermobacter ehrlichii]